MRLIKILAIAGLILCAGCGKSYVRVHLDRPDNLKQPAWVGVYFLSQESVLDDLDNIRLSDPDAVPLGEGIVDKEVYPIYPGEEVRRIERLEFDPEIRWVVIAAGFPDAQRCAREKVRVDEGAKLTLTVTVDEKCINLDTD